MSYVFFELLLHESMRLFQQNQLQINDHVNKATILETITSTMTLHIKMHET